MPILTIMDMNRANPSTARRKGMIHPSSKADTFEYSTRSRGRQQDQDNGARASTVPVASPIKPRNEMQRVSHRDAGAWGSESAQNALRIPHDKDHKKRATMSAILPGPLPSHMRISKCMHNAQTTAQPNARKKKSEGEARTNSTAS
ncbi:hypothetical protein FB451DRAFT_1188153 [Mycena latifolia]|nr:hypothetical protein FB451DRAFT_1188153 [Mycena latifolia]